MIDKILNFYESIATPLYKKQGVFVGIALVGLFIGLVFIESQYSIVGFWGIVVSIWCGGLAIFSRLYALTEDALVGEDYVKSSLARGSSALIALLSLTFMFLWFVGLIVISAILASKTLG